MWGIRGRALFHPRLPTLWAGCRGPLPTGFGRGGVRACGPVTNPTARALASWLCALWGRHEGARGGGAPPAWVWGVQCRALSHPRLPGPTTHWLWVRGGAGVGSRHQPYSARSCKWLCAQWGRHEGARGGAPCLGVGRPGSGALPPPSARPLGGLPGPTTHWLWVRGGAGVGTRHQPHSARSFELALHAVGAARGRPGGGASCLGVGRPVSGALPPPTAGAHYPLAVGAGGCGRGEPSPTLQRALLQMALRAMGAA